MDLKKVNLVSFVIIFFLMNQQKNIARKDTKFSNLATNGKMEQLTLCCFAINTDIKEQPI